MEFELLDFPILVALAIVVAAIVVDALLGMILALKEQEFDLRKMAQFLATNILPYAGGLSIFGLVAFWLPEPYSAAFYAAATLALVKYLAEIKDKLSLLLGIDLNTEKGD
jgi:uncharacterized membrane protein YfcA